MRWHSIAVRTVRCHRVVCVRNRDDAREERDLVVGDTVGIAVPVDPFVVVPHNASDLLVVSNLREDSLANNRMLLHEAPFVRRQWTRFLQESRRKSNLADVVHETTQVCHLRFASRETKSSCDIACIGGDGGRMAGGVSISLVKRCDECSRERYVSSFLSHDSSGQLLCRCALLVVKQEELLCR